MCYICTVPIKTGAGSLKSWKAIKFWLGRTIGTVLSTYYAVGKARLIRYDAGSIPVLITLIKLVYEQPRKWDAFDRMAAMKSWHRGGQF